MKRGAMISQPKDSSELRGTTACRPPEVEFAHALGIEKTRRNIRRLADQPKSGAWAIDGNYFACPEGFYDISNWCHAYRFDPRTGQALRPANYCGFSVDSHWARGAAWAIYGFALSYGYTLDPGYLETALNLARKFVANLDAAAIPAWDFKLPQAKNPLRDSSAAAIAVCGIQELLRHQPAEAGLRAAARRMLARLCSQEYLDVDASWGEGTEFWVDSVMVSQSYPAVLLENRSVPSMFIGANPQADTVATGANQYRQWGGDMDDIAMSTPRRRDTDGDGPDDGQEWPAKSDPRNPDTDGDGLTDGAEINIYGSNPLLVDSDGDGIKDNIEVATGTNPAVADTGFDFGLLMHLPLDKDFNSKLTWFVANGVTANPIGYVKLSEEGKFGGCFHGDGLGYLNVNGNEDLFDFQGGQDMSVSLWCTADAGLFAAGLSSQTLIAKGDAANTWRITRSGSDDWFGAAGGGGALATDSSFTPIGINVWRHVVLVSKTAENHEYQQPIYAFPPSFRSDHPTLSLLPMIRLSVSGILLATILPAALLGAEAPKSPPQTAAAAPTGAAEPVHSQREARAREIEAKIGREGLTLADQLRGARELRQRLWNDPQRPRYHFELKPGEPLRLQVFLDRSVLEVYANGRQCLTQRIYPSRADSLGVGLITRGGSVKVKSLDAWDISPVNSW